MLNNPIHSKIQSQNCTCLQHREYTMTGQSMSDTSQQRMRYRRHSQLLLQSQSRTSQLDKMKDTL